MSKKTGILFVTMGAVLIISALLLLTYNRMEAERAGQKAELLLSELQAVMAKQQDETGSDLLGLDDSETTAPTETVEEEEQQVVLLDGYAYIGYLSIADLELVLPVMADWDYDRLRLAPCRQFGSSRTDDLVIAAHNYESHFGTLSKLPMGTEICFTDMDETENRYLLKKIRTLDPEEVDAVQNSGYDLVLYTCTPGGAYRVAAFCERVVDSIG